MATEILLEGGRGDIDVTLLSGRADLLLAALQLPSAELSVLLCDDESICSLNAQWRGKNTPTDVLSFPQQQWTAPWVPGKGRAPHLLGDIVISTETAARQADERGHSCEVEICVLLVHGLLHLLGYDHEPPHDPSPMRSYEASLLEQLGIDGAAALTSRVG